MDRASLRSVENLPGTPAYLKELPEAAAGLLVEFQAPNEAQQRAFESSAAAVLAGLTLLRPADFTTDPVEQAKLWKIRKGMFPSVGAVRAAATTALMEDIALPIDRLAEAAMDLRALFTKHGYTTPSSSATPKTATCTSSSPRASTPRLKSTATATLWTML